MDTLRLIPDLPETFWQPSGALRKVRDGLALTIDRRITLLTADQRIVSQVEGRCRLTYDIWGETFFLVDSVYQPIMELKFTGAKGRDALMRCASVPIPNLKYDQIHVLTLVNPVDAKQEERTRDWLATKGIGGTGTGVVGRALGAVINLKTESTVEYVCSP